VFKKTIEWIRASVQENFLVISQYKVHSDEENRKVDLYLSSFLLSNPVINILVLSIFSPYVL
jgi:hypothetical protein